MKIVALASLCSNIIDCPHSTPEWKEEGIPVIRNYNLIDGYIDMDNLSYVDQATYKKRIERANPEAGDIIISREAPMGVVGIVPPNFKCCLGQRLVLLKVDKSKCNPYYLLYALMFDFVQQQIKAIDATGSIVSNLNIPDLRQLQIPLIDQQLSIASLLKSIDFKINTNKEILKQIEKLVTTIFGYWFLQFDFPNKEGKPYKSSGGKMLFNNKLKQKIPANWQAKKIGELIIENKKSKIKVKDVTSRGEVPFFTSGNSILLTDNSLVNGMNIYLNTGGNADVKAYYGAASYSTDTWSITAKNGNAYYLASVIKAMKPSMDKVFFQGTGLRHLQKKLLKDYYVVLPEKNVVKQFEDLVSDCYKRKEIVFKQNLELKKLKEYLSPLLMNEQVVFNENE